MEYQYRIMEISDKVNTKKKLFKTSTIIGIILSGMIIGIIWGFAIISS